MHCSSALRWLKRQILACGETRASFGYQIDSTRKTRLQGYIVCILLGEQLDDTSICEVGPF